MKCPYCHNKNDKVMDSRFRKEGSEIRRRRLCLDCGRRFTTYERVEPLELYVIKKDGRREPFDRDKVMAGIRKACEKLTVSVDQMESMVDQIERNFIDLGEREIPTQSIGEIVMQKLHETDDVAYVRFASVYRSFKDINDFMAQLKELLDAKNR